MPAGSPFLSLDPAARPAAMAGAYTAMSGNIDTLPSNPGGLATLEVKQAAFTHAEWFVGTRYDYMAFGAPTPAGNFGISAIRLGYGDLEGRDASQKPTGSFDAHDSAYSLGYAHELWGGFGFGGALKVVERKIDTSQASSYAMDAGLVKTLPSRTLSFGASVLNAGPGTRFIDQTDPLPLTLALGAAYVPREWLRAELDLKHQPHDALTFAGMGIEGAPVSRLVLRAGYQLPFGNSGASGPWDMNNVRGGLGIKVSRFRFDYALAPFADLGLTHRFTLETEFGDTASDTSHHLLKFVQLPESEPATQLLTQIELQEDAFHSTP
jgi:hypothetical protein